MSESAAEHTGAGTVDRKEVERFARIAKAWWEPEGEFRPLHKLNPLQQVTYLVLLNLLLPVLPSLARGLRPGMPVLA